MIAILGKEFKHYFKSPIGYVFMGFVFVVFGILFTVNLFYQNSDYSQVVGSQLTIMFVLFFGTPLITMKLLAEEKNKKTDQLIITSPINITDFILGKYLAASGLFLLTIILTMIQPLILSIFGEIPIPKIIGSYIGFMLLGCSLIAMGLFISALSSSQMIAAVVTYIVFLAILFSDTIILTLPKDRLSSILFASLLVIIITLLVYFIVKNIVITITITAIGIAIIVMIYIVNPIFYDDFMINFFGYFSLLARFKTFTMGILDLGSIIYYISISIMFVFLSVQVIEKRRWS
ncbi:ABC transporter permease [Vallitalea guaymasensis]|uniref:ABC transporter permease n=1 Tax=Vallitalea guaymasensis TaxID=1185412 RepID=A0A8J8MB83_9FIRM|nr:ABC transporter permease [Vallitalea guaymasensis]QUH29718.1 ABC transporter permease [Vallitalea guaymasensis]